MWILLNISIWYSGTIFSGAVVWQRHIIPLCKCGGEFSKACQLSRRGTEQPLICSAVCGEDVWALQWHNTQCSLQSPCTHSHPHNAPRWGTINTKGLGCYSDMRSILPLAGPQSPHFPVNHLPNNEPQFTPSPLLSPPVILPHRAIRYP